jgi:hypothetical protein
MAKSLLVDIEGSESMSDQELLAAMQRRIDDWQTLKRRLASPRTILCLGNGPTSELPELRDMAHDCLMRVNWRWQTRGMLTQPDVVFVGDPQGAEAQVPIQAEDVRPGVVHVVVRMALPLPPHGCRVGRNSRFWPGDVNP